VDSVGQMPYWIAHMDTMFTHVGNSMISIRVPHRFAIMGSAMSLEIRKELW